MTLGISNTDSAAMYATGFANIRDQMPKVSIILVGGALAGPGTSSEEPDRIWEVDSRPEMHATVSGKGWHPSGGPADLTQATQQAIFELRRISGLTWEQLGKLFGVTRRGVHYWASGKPMTAENEQRLMGILDVVRASDRGDARTTRAALFETKNGESGFELLSSGRYSKAREILETGVHRERPELSRLGEASASARKPLPPESLVDARQGRVHRDRGLVRSVRTVETSRREPT